MADLKQELAGLRIEREPERGGVARWILWVGAFIVLATVGVAGWRWATRERPVEVQAAAVTERAAGTQAAVLNASGYVTARRRATVSSKITGKAIEGNGEAGRAVRPRPSTRCASKSTWPRPRSICRKPISTTP